MGFSTTLAFSSSTIIYKAPEPLEIIQVLGNASTTAVEALVRENADKFHISYNEFQQTLWCESHYESIQSRVPSKTGPNGREDSWGVAQIHLPAHPDITKKQALDPVFAVAWAAEQFSKHRQDMWTCWVNLFSTPSSTAERVKLPDSVQMPSFITLLTIN